MGVLFSPCSADVMTMGGLFLNFQCGKWAIIVQLDLLNLSVSHFAVHKTKITALTTLTGTL